MISISSFFYSIPSEIRDFIDAEARAMPGCSLGVMCGPAWASLKMSSEQWGNLRWLDRLEDHLRGSDPQIRDRRIDWWFTRLEKGGEVLHHNHSDAMLAGAYYPDKFGGRLWIECDSPNGQEFNFAYGTLVVLPGDMAHAVSPSPGVRRSVAFNIYA